MQFPGSSQTTVVEMESVVDIPARTVSVISEAIIQPDAQSDFELPSLTDTISVKSAPSIAYRLDEEHSLGGPMFRPTNLVSFNSILPDQLEHHIADIEAVTAGPNQVPGMSSRNDISNATSSSPSYSILHEVHPPSRSPVADAASSATFPCPDCDRMFRSAGLTRYANTSPQIPNM
jgi:hypothetical protein